MQTVPSAGLKQLILLIIGRRQHCRVDGFSMFPTLKNGDFVIYRTFNSIEPAPDPGSILIIEHPQRPEIIMIKRLIKISESGFDVRGDNQNASTDSREFGYLKPVQIKGIVEAVIA